MINHSTGRNRLLIGLLAIVVTVPLAAAAERRLPTAQAEQVGMSSERLARIDALTRRYVDEGKLAGAVTLVAREGKVVYFDAVGQADLDTGAPMRRDTLFRIYSMSKPITSVALMMLYEEGAFQLADPIAKFLPELAALEVLQDDGTRVPAQPITFQQLLTHTAGFSYGFNPQDPLDQMYGESKWSESRDLDAFIATLATLPLKFQPGSRWHYSVANDVQGALVERISGQRFDVFLKTRIFEPLGMHDTFFDVPAEKRARLGTNHAYDTESGKLVVLPAPAYPIYQGTTFCSGGAGLVSTAADYARFAEMLRNGGTLDKTRILSPKTVQFMTMNHLPALLQASGSGEQPGISGLRRQNGITGAGFGLGFAVISDVPAAGVIGSAGEYNWGGAAGTIFWIDPVEDLVVVTMIQLMRSPWPLRSELKAVTYQALTHLNGS